MARAVGDPLGRCGRGFARPGGGARDGLPPRHLQIPVRRRLPRGRGGLPQRLRARILPEVRLARDRGQRKGLERGQEVALPFVRPLLQRDHRDDIRVPPHTRRRLDGVPARDLLLREPQGNGQVEQEVEDDAPVLARQALRRAVGRPGRRRPQRQRADRREVLPAVGRGAAAQGGRHEAARPVEEPDLHRRGLRRLGPLVLLAPGAGGSRARPGRGPRTPATYRRALT